MLLLEVDVVLLFIYLFVVAAVMPPRRARDRTPANNVDPNSPVALLAAMQAMQHELETLRQAITIAPAGPASAATVQAAAVGAIPAGAIPARAVPTGVAPVVQLRCLLPLVAFL